MLVILLFLEFSLITIIVAFLLCINPVTRLHADLDRRLWDWRTRNAKSRPRVIRVGGDDAVEWRDAVAGGYDGDSPTKSVSSLRRNSFSSGKRVELFSVFKPDNLSGVGWDPRDESYERNVGAGKS
ncbi:MAG TPA: hypothetical protein EYQ80_04355 [Candidatus Poseidoniales archaeon]|nr:hypothetical protein [Candidatus Poseidoniales archaeon]